ncbi:dickkopf-related protein 3-like [Montipora capricornis]|uniref:dickkopf-related protein 3-like n=1 Tax=Montipora capricornis TaxID=246305 RepID=UPI0035F1BF7E
MKNMMRKNLLLVIFLLVCVEVVESVVHSWIMSVNPVDTDNSEENLNDNRTKGNSTFRHCRKDRHCGQGHYCHRHKGFCHACQDKIQKCRRDKMCCNGMECVFGHCRVAKPRGTEGGKCRRDKPKCDAGFCCANVHGHPICKQLLQEGEDCEVPEGGLEYSLNQRCHCASGLICRRVKHQHKKRLVSRNDRKKWVCQRL